MNKDWISQVFISLFISMGLVNPPNQKLVMYTSVNCKKGINNSSRSINIFYPSPETWKKNPVWTGKIIQFFFKLGKKTVKTSDEHIICLKIRYNYYLVYQNILSLLELVVPVSNHKSYLMTKEVGNFSHLRCNRSNCKIWFHFCRLRTKIDKQSHLKCLLHFPTNLLHKCSILL